LTLSKHAIETAVYYAFLLGLTYFLMIQVRKPSRWVGQFFTSLMNVSHSALTDWGLTHVSIEPNFTILDVGCGGGRTIEKLAALAPNGTVYGIDYANGSVAASRAHNTQLIQAGRVEITKASVSQLPFPDNKFDLVTAIETQYYWPDLLHDMQEILRVLKPAGTLVVIAESYKKGAHQALQAPVMKLLRTKSLGVEDHRELFSKAGYADIQIYEERAKGWLCGTGKKPASPPSYGA